MFAVAPDRRMNHGAGLRTATAVGLGFALSIAGCGSREPDPVDRSAASPGGINTSAPVAPETTLPVADAAAPSSLPGDQGTTSGAPPNAEAAPPTETSAARAPHDFSPAPPAAGSYRFQIRGTSNGAAVDRLSVTTIEAVDERTVRVVRADGERTLQQFFGEDGIAVEYVKISITGTVREFVLDPPERYLQFPARPGATWSWDAKSTNGSTRIALRSTIRGDAPLTVAGTPVTATVVDTVITVSGDYNGTLTLESWFDPSRALVVQQRERADFGILFQSDTTTSYISGPT